MARAPSSADRSDCDEMDDDDMAMGHPFGPGGDMNGSSVYPWMRGIAGGL